MLESQYNTRLMIASKVALCFQHHVSFYLAKDITIEDCKQDGINAIND